MKDIKHKVGPGKRRPYKEYRSQKLTFKIPNIDAFINWRTAAYIGKVSRSNNNIYPRKFLAAWVNTNRKNGAVMIELLFKMLQATVN
jgi:hypothetical protein